MEVSWVISHGCRVKTELRHSCPCLSSEVGRGGPPRRLGRWAEEFPCGIAAGSIDGDCPTTLYSGGGRSLDFRAAFVPSYTARCIIRTIAARGIIKLLAQNEISSQSQTWYPHHDGWRKLLGTWICAGECVGKPSDCYRGFHDAHRDAPEIRGRGSEQGTTLYHDVCSGWRQLPPC